MANFDIPTPNVDAFNKNLKSVSSLKKDFDVATPIADSYNYAYALINEHSSYMLPSYPAITTDSGTVNHFLTKLDNWVFCPPSSNLWTVEIVPNEPVGTNDLYQLYHEIFKANNFFKTNYATHWGVLYENVSSLGVENIKKVGNEAFTFIRNLQNDNKIGLFLANQMSFTTHDAVVQTSPGAIGIHTGFITHGMVTQGKQSHDRRLEINFLQTNWDISEILIDPWIAAVTQQGLIEASNLPKIKAKIILSEYASAIPRNDSKTNNSSSTNNTWFLRKRIIFNKVVPTNKEQTKLSYSQDSAGSFETCNVTFAYENYKIIYNGEYIVSQ